MGLAKYLAGKPGFEKETLKSLGLQAKFRFQGGDFEAAVGNQDVTGLVMQQMEKELGKQPKKEYAFQIAALGQGVKKVMRGEYGNVQEDVVDPGQYIGAVDRGLQPMYKLKSSGGASMAVSSYVKRSDAPNMFTPGGPALSHAEVLDYVIRNKMGKDVAVGSSLGHSRPQRNTNHTSSKVLRCVLSRNLRQPTQS